MPKYRAVLFDNGDTLFHKPYPFASIMEIGRTLGANLDEQDARAAYAEIKIAKRSIVDDQLRFGRNRSVEGHRAFYTACYEPLNNIAAGFAQAFYEQFKTNPETMVPYPDTTSTLRMLYRADIAIGVVSNTGWNIRQGYELHGLTSMISSYVLSYEHGCAKPDPTMWELACKDLDIEPRDVLMVGNNPTADSGAVAIGATSLILPSVERETPRGLDAVLRLTGISDDSHTSKI